MYMCILYMYMYCMRKKLETKKIYQVVTTALTS